ncbi:MAG: nitroreductase family protein [Candidatus Bathyarchaeia archaeon]
MEFLELVRKRRSIRRYKSDPVPQWKLEYILEAARLAPSWGNRQCWRFIVVADEERRRAVTTREWQAEAPLVIVGCAYPSLSGSRFGQQYYMLDMGIAMEHMVLAAAEKGLGTCWIGGQFDEEAVKRVLGIPEDVRVVALTPLGYPAETPRPKGRKKTEEIVSYERW